MFRLLILCGLGRLAMRVIRENRDQPVAALIPSPERMRRHAAAAQPARRGGV